MQEPDWNEVRRLVQTEMKRNAKYTYREDQEELCGDIVLFVWKHWQKQTLHPGSLLPLIRVMVDRHLVSRLKTAHVRYRKREIPLSTIDEEIELEGFTPPEGLCVPDPTERLCERLDAEKVIDQKFEDRKYPLAERAWRLLGDGYSYNEIAEMLGVPWKGLDNLFNRERQELRQPAVYPASPRPWKHELEKKNVDSERPT